ncbi:N-acetylmuramoyl-L-alanine amidase [Lachnospiraceae bacterium C7]|nr:N-acetylmuramoyl-L-alanine amidase [Lachnospiraceae bacterium C7]
MDEKVLKGLTISCGILTLMFCILVFFLPDMRLKAQKLKENQESMKFSNVQEVIEKRDDLLGRIMLNMPEGISKDDVEVENLYMKRKIKVIFPKIIDDFFSQYKMAGSCNHIDEIKYYKSKEKSIIEFSVDKVYEVKKEFQADKIFIQFVDPHEIYDKVVVVDPGHGGDMPGAMKQGVTEKDINLDIVNELKAISEEKGNSKIKFYFTREDDTNPSLEERVSLANDSDADLFISVHNNASSDGKMSSLNGTQVMYDEKSIGKHGSKHFAEICLNNVCKSLGSYKRGLLKGDSIYIIRNSKVPVALIEVGFMTNSREIELLKSKNYQKKAADGIYNSVTQAFEEGY